MRIRRWLLKVTMANKRYKWTEEWKAYLRKYYRNHTAEYLIRGLRKKGYGGSKAAMMEMAKKRLGLAKDEAWLKRYKQELARQCIEKRGGEEFNERQRQRALHPGESGWWGGRHNDGCKAGREKLQEMARRVFHTPEARKKCEESRRKSVRRDIRRVQLGLEPLTSIPNIGDAMPKKMMTQRYAMCYECGYIKYKGDRNLYYDENTRRSTIRERRAESLGITVMELSQRGKTEVMVPHYDERSRFNNDNL